MSWPYDAPVDRLAGALVAEAHSVADALGVAPRHRRHSGIGGPTPQVLVQDAARAIVAGELDVALVVGAEALET